MESLDEEMYHVFSLMGKSFGLKDAHMKLVATLYMEPDYISMDDISKKTGYSLASISMSIRLLEDIGIVTHIRKQGTKKQYYLLEKDLLLVNIKKMDMMSRTFIQPAKKTLPGMIVKFKNAAGKKNKEKLKIIENFNKQLLTMEKLIMKWQKDLEAYRDG